MAAARTCDRCGNKLAPGVPRRRRGRELICPDCAGGGDGRVQSDPQALAYALRTEAHDRGESDVVLHCPFDGSGQVVGWSDGTIECQFCGQHFTVQVQPERSAMPQTVDGQPVDIPGMPGVEDTPLDEEPTLPGEEVNQAEQPAPAEVGEAAEEQAATPGPSRLKIVPTEDSGGGGRQLRVVQTSFVTDRGHVLVADDYLAHLALRLTTGREERDLVLARVRARHADQES